MRGPSARVWLASLGCLVVLFAAVAWVSATVIDLEDARATMRQRAWVEENVRLGLWRMDSAIAPLVARESARPVTGYRAADTGSGSYTSLRFELDESGRLSTTPGAALDGLATRLDPVALERALARERERGPLLASAGLVSSDTDQLAPVPAQAERQEETLVAIAEGEQVEKSAKEFAKRRLSVGSVYANSMTSAIGNHDGLAVDAADAADQASVQVSDQVSDQASDTGDRADNTRSRTRARGASPMTPLWVEDRLLLVRRVDAGDQTRFQGAVIDWPVMRTWLLASVSDLLPEARLLPMDANPSADPPDPARTLVSLPVTLVAGPIPAASDQRSAVWWILVPVWCAVLLAAGAAIALVLGVSALSERRAAFVAAVTHELRTPLTTIRTYSEMLADGKVARADKQTRYLRTLEREAVRLSHLVDNVLAYSRVEHTGKSGLARDPLSARALLEHAGERLRDRAQGAAMELTVDLPASGHPLRFQGDAAAVEQIVFNLVDNACKYASGADQRVIQVSAAAQGPAIVIRVRDHGPGIAADVRPRLFKPFSKSVETAARSAPGVGLGLALSRRLAREMGGDLELEPTPTATGSCFALSLPRADTDNAGDAQT